MDQQTPSGTKKHCKVLNQKVAKQPALIFFFLQMG